MRTLGTRLFVTDVIKQDSLNSALKVWIRPSKSISLGDRSKDAIGAVMDSLDLGWELSL